MQLKSPVLKMHLPISCLFLAFLGLSACVQKSAKKEGEEEKAVALGTPVTVTTPSRDEPLIEYTELSATSVFLQKSYVKANVNGYITQLTTQPGKYVSAGQVLFTLKTKEAQSIGNSVNALDPSFRFSGVNTIKASGPGYITQINHLQGDYVQDGEQLAVISDLNSFAFILSLPYSLKRDVNIGSQLKVLLPDGKELMGTVASAMPTVDPAAQTQNIVLKVSERDIPENLLAKVRIVTMKKEHVVSLPKNAVLTNDVQSDFWIMKLIDSSTAVKVPIKKGAETKDRVEILEPTLSTNDKILITGNFGLPDTAKIVVTQ